MHESAISLNESPKSRQMFTRGVTFGVTLGVRAIAISTPVKPVKFGTQYSLSGAKVSLSVTVSVFRDGYAGGRDVRRESDRTFASQVF